MDNVIVLHACITSYTKCRPLFWTFIFMPLIIALFFMTEIYVNGPLTLATYTIVTSCVISRISPLSLSLTHKQKKGTHIRLSLLPLYARFRINPTYFESIHSIRFCHQVPEAERHKWGLELNHDGESRGEERGKKRIFPNTINFSLPGSQLCVVT